MINAILNINTSNQALSIRGQIDYFEDTLRNEIDSGNMVQTISDCKEDNDQASHYFGEGVYCRSLLIPKGTVVVGKLHKYDRVCIISSGSCTFVNEFERQTVSAPWMGEFKAGSKTVVYAHEDTMWVACHKGNEERDADKLLDVLIADDHKEYKEHLLLLEKIV